MDRKYWTDWALFLKQKNITGLAVSLLEGSGPVRVFLSQFLLGFLPLFGQYSHNSWSSFAELLEDPSECRSFSAFLLEEKNA